MTVKELREYRVICAELEQIDSKFSKSNTRFSTVSALARKSELTSEKIRLEKFLDSIKSRKIKRAIYLYCFECLSLESAAPTWGDVAAALGDGSTENSIKKAVERYLKEIA